MHGGRRLPVRGASELPRGGRSARAGPTRTIGRQRHLRGAARRHRARLGRRGRLRNRDQLRRRRAGRAPRALPGARRDHRRLGRRLRRRPGRGSRPRRAARTGAARRRRSSRPSRRTSGSRRRSSWRRRSIAAGFAHDACSSCRRVVFAEAEHDEVAAEIVERLADEIVALARVALERLDLTRRAGRGAARRRRLLRTGQRPLEQRDRGGACSEVGPQIIGPDTELAADRRRGAARPRRARRRAEAQERPRRELEAAVAARARRGADG